MSYEPVCDLDRIPLGGGVCVLLDGVQVAVFRTADGEVHAISNLDPCSGAMVLSRGIVGSRGGVAVVASPLHKQAFDLTTGECLDAPGVSVSTYPVRVVAGTIEVDAEDEAEAA